MRMLSAAYMEVKRLRSTGGGAAACDLLRSTPPASDEDAFEAAVCLFVCGDFDGAVRVCATHGWKQQWARNITQALSMLLQQGDPARALALARQAAADARAGHDAIAIFLLTLQANGAVAEADAYIKRHLQGAPAGETFLLTVMAEIAAAAHDWLQAYKLASAVIANDPDDFRALMTLSIANYSADYVYDSLGSALRANEIRAGAQPAVLQIMRCRNRLGDYYGAIAAFDEFRDRNSAYSDLLAELGAAYSGIDSRSRAAAAYRKALATGQRPMEAVRGLLKILTASGDADELESFRQAYAAEINGDAECLHMLGLARVAKRDVEGAMQAFRASFELARQQADVSEYPLWPVPEPVIRHDYEQLELLGRRGRLDAAGQAALRELGPHYEQTGDVRKVFAPADSRGAALRKALARMHRGEDPPYEGVALGVNDYGAIEDTYFASHPSLVVIDNFLAPGALAALRRYCEEAAVWKLYNPRGYVGALLAQGFFPRVLLATMDELKQAMPRVIGDHAPAQAWAFKYDQRMQGINLHADFAKINVNFWITPDAACEDPETGGMVIYDVPAPQSWTFADYNRDQARARAYLDAHDARPIRVSYRCNRCVLFDSSLFHYTDELHFRPGYENRRVNVTLLYGRARGLE